MISTIDNWLNRFHSISVWRRGDLIVHWGSEIGSREYTRINGQRVSHTGRRQNEPTNQPSNTNNEQTWSELPSICQLSNPPGLIEPLGILNDGDEDHWNDVDDYNDDDDDYDDENMHFIRARRCDWGRGLRGRFFDETEPRSCSFVIVPKRIRGGQDDPLKSSEQLIQRVPIKTAIELDKMSGESKHQAWRCNKPEAERNSKTNQLFTMTVTMTNSSCVSHLHWRGDVPCISSNLRDLLSRREQSF